MFGHDPEAEWMTVMSCLNQLIRLGAEDGGYFAAHRMSNFQVRYLFKNGRVDSAIDEMTQQEEALEQAMHTVGYLAKFVKDRFPMWSFDQDPRLSGQPINVCANGIEGGDLVRLHRWDKFYETTGVVDCVNGFVMIEWVQPRWGGPELSSTYVEKDVMVEVIRQSSSSSLNATA